MRRILWTMLLGALSAAAGAQDSVNLRCGEDLLQLDLAQRKLAFRAWSRPINVKAGIPNGASFVGYLGPNSQFRLPAGVTPDLGAARRLENDQDMGLNSWIRVLYLHDANPQLTPVVRQQIEDVLFHFQYWVDEPLNAPGDVAQRSEKKQVFWSENHQAMYGTLEFLVGQKYPDRTFRDGRTGAQHRDKARARLMRWLEERLVFGFSEWNSPGYYEWDIVPLLNLVDFSADPLIAKRAAIVLDLLFFDVARFTQRGSFGVTAGRVYANQKSSGWSQSIGDTIEILFGTRGQFRFSDSASAHALATTTRYCVPSVLLAIGRDKPERFVDLSRVSINPGDPGAPGMTNFEDGLSWWSRGGYLLGQMRFTTEQMWRHWNLPSWLGEDRSEFAQIQPMVNGQTGILSEFFEGVALTRANLYTYRDSGAMLSSVQQFRPGQMGPQMNAWQVTIDPDVTVWGTYPYESGGGDGPNWWTGNWVMPFVFQRESAAIAVYAPDPISPQGVMAGHRTHLWFPFGEQTFDQAAYPGIKDYGLFAPAGPKRFDRFRMVSNSDGPTWIFGMKRVPEGEAYVGVYSARSCVQSTTGAWAGKEISCDGLRNVFIIQVGSNKTFGTFERFMAECHAARIHLGTGLSAPMNPFVDVQVSYDSPDPVMRARGNHRMEVHYDKGQARFGGQILNLQEFPRFRNPYVNAAWAQKRYTIALGGHTLTHDRIDNVREGTGTTASSLVAPFANRHLFEADLYGVRPNGEVIWRRHAVTVDRSQPPQSDGPPVIPLGRAGIDTAQQAQQARQNAATKAAQSAATPRSQREIKGQVANNRALDATRQAAPRESQPGNANPVQVTPTPPPRIALPPSSVTQYSLGPTVANTGWQSFRTILPAGGGALGATFYGLTPHGTLQWFLHEGSQDGSPRWKGPVDVQSGWNAFTRIIPAGDGVLYGIGADGSVRWYKHWDAANVASPPRWAGPTVVKNGWGNIVHAFAMQRGVVYYVTSDGSLYWNQHIGYRDGSPQWRGPTLVGNSWAGMKSVFSPGDGVIYTVRTTGELLWYRHEGWEDGSMKWLNPIKVGDGYGEFTQLFARMPGAPPTIN